MPVAPESARKPSSRRPTRRAAGLLRAVIPSRINAVPALRTETSSSEETPFSRATLLTLPLTAKSTAAPRAMSIPLEAREGLVMCGCRQARPAQAVRAVRRARAARAVRGAGREGGGRWLGEHRGGALPELPEPRESAELPELPVL